MSRRPVLLCSSVLVLSLLAASTSALGQTFAPAPLWSRYRPHMWLRAHLARLRVVPPVVAYSRPVYYAAPPVVTAPVVTTPLVVASVNAPPLPSPSLTYAPPPPPGYAEQSYAAPGDAPPTMAYAEHTVPKPPQVSTPPITGVPEPASAASAPPDFASPEFASPEFASPEFESPIASAPLLISSDRFYCADRQAWYPDVMSCADGWQRVPARPR
jgi:hypothetical protein